MFLYQKVTSGWLRVLDCSIECSGTSLGQFFVTSIKLIELQPHFVRVLLLHSISERLHEISLNQFLVIRPALRARNIRYHWPHVHRKSHLFWKLRCKSGFAACAPLCWTIIFRLGNWYLASSLYKIRRHRRLIYFVSTRIQEAGRTVECGYLRCSFEK